MLRLNTFGGLVLQQDGQLHTGPASQRRRLALLAVVAAAGARGVSRDKLLTLLWPESEAEAVPAAEFDALVARFKEQLGDRIADVRATDRLVDNALRLVWPDNSRGHEMDRVRRMLEKDFTVPQKVVELNRHHPLIKNLAGRVTSGDNPELVSAVIEQLYESALLVEGLLPNPAAMVGRIQRLMEAATRK